MLQHIRHMPVKKHASGRIKIDRNIPLPESRRNGDPYRKYPFREMEVGDSFLFPKAIGVNTARSNIAQTSRRLGRKFVIRQTERGVRCWRTE